MRDIGPDYAITLRAWREAWEEKREAILQLGYTERFWRKYRRACPPTPSASETGSHSQHSMLWGLSGW